MNLQKAEFRESDGTTTLYMVVDGETQIKVTGYGTGEYTIQVSSTHPVDYAPELKIAEAAKTDPANPVGAAFWGPALVWAEPVTIAHVVMNFLSNY